MQGSQIYSSSISLVSNGQVIGALTTHNGKIVITGPTDIPQNAIQGGREGNELFNDSWFNSALKSQPPAPGITGPSGWSSIDVNVIRTNTEIGFWIQNPQQTLFGDILVPYINNIRIEIPPANSNSKINILSSSSYTPSGNSPIEAFVISKIKNSGYYDNFEYPDGNGSKATYVYSNPDIGNYILNDKITVNIWFENTVDKNAVPNVLTVPLSAFLEAFPPSVVRNVIFANTATTSTRISWLTPSFASGNNNNANISQYKIEYNSISSPNRFIYVGQTGSVLVGNTGGTNLTSLIPGTNYIAKVSAQNDITSTFGPGGTGLFITQNPPAPTVPSAVTLSLPQSNYFSNIRSVANGGSIPNPVYSFNTNGGVCNTLTNFPIHSSSTIGSTGINLMNFDFLINGDSQYRIDFNGFGVNPAFTTSIAQNNKASFSTPTIVDAGSGNTTNFYRRVSTITPSLNLNNGTPLPAGNSYTSQLKYFLSPSTTINSSINSFYIDDLSLSPSITGVELADSFDSKKITGISIVGNIGAANLNYKVNARNFARYFYRNDKIILLDDTTTGVTTNNAIISSLPSGTPSPIPIDADIEFNGVASVSFNIANFSYGINYTASVFSPLTSAGTTVTSNNVAIQKMYDGPSYNKNIHTSIPNTGNIGYRVLTQAPLDIEPNPGVFNLGYTNYDNNVSLLNTSYLNELPIIIGKYTSANGNANTTTYLNNCNLYGGVNYSTIANETKFRYMTYIWNMDMTKTTTLTSLRFIFSGFIGNGKLSRNDNRSSIDTSGVFRAYYRFEQIGPGGLVLQPQTETTNPANYTSYWIDANSFGSSFSGFINRPAYNGIGGLIYTPNDISPINTPTVNNFTYNVKMRSLPQESGITGIRIYFMVGIAMNSGISFDDIICSVN